MDSPHVNRPHLREAEFRTTHQREEEDYDDDDIKTRRRRSTSIDDYSDDSASDHDRPKRKAAAAKKGKKQAAADAVGANELRSIVVPRSKLAAFCAAPWFEQWVKGEQSGSLRFRDLKLNAFVMHRRLGALSRRSRSHGPTKLSTVPS